MRRSMRVRLAALLLALTLLGTMGLSMQLSAALAQETPGKEDLSGLTAEELAQLASDIDNELKQNHQESNRQKEQTLAKVEEEISAYYAAQGINISLAWFPSETTYSRDRNIFTVDTYIDYTDDSGKHREDVYAELYLEDGSFSVTYLLVGGTAIINERERMERTVQGVINGATQINLGAYSEVELNALKSKVQSEISRNHTPSERVANLAISLTKMETEQYFVDRDLTVIWSEDYRDYECILNWDRVTVRTLVDYDDVVGTLHTDEVYSECAKVGRRYELRLLRVGDRLIYEYEEPVETPAPVPETEGEGEAEAEATPAPVIRVEDLPLKEASDEELAEIASAIRAEQRERIPTQIELEPMEVTLNIGQSVAVEASIIDLPEGEDPPELEWAIENKNIASYAGGMVKGVSGGSTVLRVWAKLAGGLEIDQECLIQVNTPVSAIVPAEKEITISAGEAVVPEFIIEPEGATNKDVKLTTADKKIVTVNGEGAIQGVKKGKTTIKATAADGSGATASMRVNVIDLRISKPDVEKVALTVIANDRAGDLLAADGVTWQKNKFRKYSDFVKKLKLTDDTGEYESEDGGRTWQVTGLTIQDENEKYYRYSMTVTWDGKDYHVTDLTCVSSTFRKGLESEERSERYEIRDETEAPYLLVSSKQV